MDRTPSNTDKHSTCPCHAHRGAHECILDSTCGELIGAQPFNANVHLLFFSGKILSFKLNQIRSTSIAKRDVRVGQADHHLQHAAASRGRAAARGDGRGHRPRAAVPRGVSRRANLAARPDNELLEPGKPRRAVSTFESAKLSSHAPPRVLVQGHPRGAGPIQRS